LDRLESEVDRLNDQIYEMQEYASDN
jgi:hypothetical protein